MLIAIMQLRYKRSEDVSRSRFVEEKLV